MLFFFFSSRRRHTRLVSDWSSDVCSSDLIDVDVDKLYVKQAVANDGPRMKRIRPAPMGRAYRYVRRIAHIELVLAEKGANSGAVASVAGEEAGVAKTAKAKRRVPAKRIKRKKTARAR